MAGGKGGSEDETKIHRRATWLNNNVFNDRQIDQEAIGAMFGMGVSRAFELFKEIEEKADQMRNPSGYLKAAAKREGLAPPGSSPRPGSAPARVPVRGKMNGGASEDDHRTIHRRATWLNANVFMDRQIDEEAMGAMLGLGVSRGLELFKEIEEKADQLRNPSGYLKTAAKREGLVPPGNTPQAQMFFQPVMGSTNGGASAEDQRTIHRRATWLNANVFMDRQIDEEAIGAMLGLGVSQGLELFKEIEEKADQLRNPSGYLKAAAKRAGLSLAGSMPLTVPAFASIPQVSSGEEQSKIHRRATWLNANVFPEIKIDDEAIAAMTAIGISRAMELFKEIEEKADKMKNPSAYLKKAAMREGLGGQPVMFSAPIPQAGASAAQDDEQSKIHRRITWLNANVFQDKNIDEEAIGSMYGVGIAKAFDLLKEIEEKAPDMRNPSGYLKKAAKNLGLVPPTSVASPRARMQSDMGWADGKTHRRITWLNANVFMDRKIDSEATDAMMGLGVARAMELLKEVEEKNEQLRNPSGYLKTAAKREGVGLAAPGGAPFAKGQGNKSSGSPDYDKIHRRVTWMNSNVFVGAPVDPEAIETIAELGAESALELLKDLEAKGPEVKNPSGYLKAAAKRALGILGPSGTKRSSPGTDGGPSKKQK